MGQRILKLLIFIVLVASAVTAARSQDVIVTATTDPKAIKAILAKEREETRINTAFFDEDRRCREFLRANEWTKAEASCKLSISLVEKLPAEHVLERSSARAQLAFALLWQKRTAEAIPLLKKSLEIRIPRAGEADADTADLYSLLGSSYGLLNDIPTASSYFEKAESSYRAAFKVIGEDADDIRVSYPRRMKRTLEAYYAIVKSAGLADETEKLRVRLAEVEKEFAKYLND